MNAAVQYSIHQRWSTWKERSTNRRIFAAMVTVGSWTVLVKLAASMKEVLTAYQFGTNEALDAFLIAFLVPQFAVNLIGGSLNAALIPSYIQVQEQEGQEAAQRLLSSVMILTTGSLLVTVLLLSLASSTILPRVASGFDQDQLALSQTLFYLLLSIIVLSGVSTIWGAVLNAHHRFVLAAVVPMVTSIATILALTMLGHTWGSYALVLGAVCGALIEAFLLGWGLGRAGVSIIPRWSGITPAVKQVLGQYAPMVAASFLMGGTSVITQAMAASLDSGSVSALAYGSKINNLALGIGAMAVSTAVLPHFSRMVAGKDWHGLRHTLGTYSRLILTVSIPVSLLLIYFSEPLVTLLFQRGAFTRTDTNHVAQIQMMYLLQIPLYVVGLLFVRLLSAMQANHVMLWGNLINLTACGALTYFLRRYWGVAGIALADTLTCVISSCFLMLVCWRLLKRTAVS